MAEREHVRVEVAFVGGHSISVAVPVESAEGLQRALGSEPDGVYELESEDGRYLLPLRNVVYVKRFSRDTHIGFGAA